MKKRIISAVLIAVVTLAVSSCSIINSILQQADELANLANCEYSLKNVSNLTIAGVNVKNVTNGNISATDVLKLSSALISMLPGHDRVMSLALNSKKELQLFHNFHRGIWGSRKK